MMFEGEHPPESKTSTTIPIPEALNSLNSQASVEDATEAFF
jgi:hypothetical protein